MAQAYRRPGQPMTGAMQAQMYHARKRRKQREEATAGNGGMRAQRPALGIIVRVTVTTQ